LNLPINKVLGIPTVSVCLVF